MIKTFYKIVSLTAIMAGIVLPQNAIALTPPAPAVYPVGGPVESSFKVYTEYQGGLGSTFWFSSGNYSTFLSPIAIDESTITFKVPATVCPGAETESCSSNFSTSTPAGVYLVYVKGTDATTGLPETTEFGTFTVTVFSSAHTEGTNVLGPDGIVYRMTPISRSPYTSAGAFLSYKFNSWATVVTANSADLALPVSTYTPAGATTPVTAFIPPRSGALINDRGTVYLLTEGGRAGFATEAVFRGLGFSFANVYPGDTSFIGLNYEPINSINIRHHDGVLINDNGTFYIMHNGFRVGVPTMEVLDSWGYWVNDAVAASTFDRQLPQSGVLQTRMVNQLNI